MQIYKNLYPTRTDSSDPGYPSGKAIDAVAEGTGTPATAAWVNDFWGAFQAILDEAGVAANATPEKVGSSQVLTALKDLFAANVGPVAAEGAALSSLVSLAVAGRVVVGGRGNVGRAAYFLKDAGSPGARPPEKVGLVAHVGAAGLYFDAIVPTGGRYDGSQFGLTPSSTDAEIQAVLELGVPVRIDGMTLKSGVVLNDTSLDLELSGDVTIDYSDSPTGFAPIQINVDFLDKQSVSEVLLSEYDYGGGATIVSRLTVDDASAYAPGDNIKIISQDLIPWLAPSNIQKMGSSHIVGAVDLVNDYVYLLDTVYQAFATDIRVARYNKDVNIKITGSAVFKREGSATTTDRYEMIRIVGGYKPQVKGLRAYGTYGEFVSFTGCYGATSREISGERLVTDTSQNQYGYVVSERCTAYSKHYGISGTQCRHVYTNGANFNPPPDDFARYGCNEFANVYDTVGINVGFSADDTHPESYYTTFHNTAAYFTYRGQNGTLWVCQMRGVGDMSLNATVHGGDGIVISGQNEVDGSTRDIRIRGFNYVPKPGEIILNAVRVKGRVGGRVTGVEIDDIKIDGCNPLTSVINLEYADAKLTNPQIKATLTHEDFMPVCYLKNSTLKIVGGSLDLTGSTSDNMRFIKLNTADSTAHVKGFDITTGGSNLLLVDFDGVDGEATFIDLNMDAPTVFADPAIDRGAGSIFNGSYAVNDGYGGATNYLDLEIATETTFSLNGYRIQENTTKEITVNIIASGVATPIRLTDIPLGRIKGQRLAITNDPASTQTIRIDAFLNIGISADRDILAGDGTTLYWNGSKWVG